MIWVFISYKKKTTRMKIFNRYRTTELQKHPRNKQGICFLLGKKVRSHYDGNKKLSKYVPFRKSLFIHYESGSKELTLFLWTTAEELKTKYQSLKQTPTITATAAVVVVVVASVLIWPQIFPCKCGTAKSHQPHLFFKFSIVGLFMKFSKQIHAIMT